MSRKKHKKKATVDDPQHYAEVIFMHEAQVHGYNQHQIADLASSHFGKTFSHDTVSRRIRRYREENVAEHVDAVRMIAVDQIDRSMVVAMDALMKNTRKTIEIDGAPVEVINVEMQLKAIDRVNRLIERKSKLLGLDAPTKVEAAVVTEESASAELKAMLADLDDRIG
jgi:hypothetical protein